ncbi:MAG TPA: type II secretion system protein GspG, partial [Stenotrophomonas maltophilia]|nr:type II secretion system protein GspG [Stenotrophomonas maltophilia]
MIASRRPIRLSFTAARNQSGMSLLEIIIVIV